jgi:hypothetical protein
MPLGLLRCRCVWSRRQIRPPAAASRPKALGCQPPRFFQLLVWLAHTGLAGEAKGGGCGGGKARESARGEGGRGLWCRRYMLTPSEDPVNLKDLIQLCGFPEDLIQAPPCTSGLCSRNGPPASSPIALCGHWSFLLWRCAALLFAWCLAWLLPTLLCPSIGCRTYHVLVTKIVFSMESVPQALVLVTLGGKE